jgi:hypothetical protein
MSKVSKKSQTKQSCKTGVSGSVLDSVNDSEYYYLGRKILVQQNFTKKEDRPFDAFYQAQSYLNDLGYEYGSLAVTSSPNVAVRKGEYDLAQKWHNLDKEEIASIDGVIISLDYREGQVTVMLFN